MHIHISSQDGEAKYWMEPQIELAQNIGLSEKQLKEAKLIIEKHKKQISNAWLKHFNS